jgi:hypothetical protein
MSAGLSVTTNARSLATSYQQAPQLLASNVRKTLQRIGARLVRAARARIRGEVTGRLRRSIQSRIELDAPGKAASVRVFTGLYYGGVQEAGRVLRPRRAANLTIPLEAAREAGIRRARTFLQAPEAFGFRTGFIAGRAVLGKRGDDDAIVPLFALRPAVNIRPKHFLKGAFEAQQAQILEDLRGDIADTLGTIAATPAPVSAGPGGGGLL